MVVQSIVWCRKKCEGAKSGKKLPSSVLKVAPSALHANGARWFRTLATGIRHDHVHVKMCSPYTMKDGSITPSSPCAHVRDVMGNIRHEKKKVGQAKRSSSSESVLRKPSGPDEVHPGQSLQHCMHVCKTWNSMCIA